MSLNKVENKNKIAIVAVGYNRLESIKRLLTSLERASYSVDVPLVISIDASGCQPLYDYVQNYEWRYGDKYVSIKETRLGLRDHILSCGDLTKYFKAVVILEDDIFVSEYFFDYVLKAVDAYDSDDRIGGISLYRPSMDRNIPIDYIVDGNDTFTIQTVESWGQCWTERMWNEFRRWYNNTSEHDFSSVDMPQFMKNWKKAWSKFYMAFQIETNRHFIYPSVSHTTCFSEAGEHGNTSNIGQSVLLSGPKDYKMLPFDELTHYDIYGTNSLIYEWLGMDASDICVDFFGYHENTRHCRYILSPFVYPYKKIKEYGLSLRPIELNIKYHIDGTGLYLYDTENCILEDIKREAPLSLVYYHVRQFNIYFLLRYVWSYLKDNIFRYIKKRF